MVTTTSDADALARIVNSDPKLPSSVRQQARQLRPLASRNPELAIKKLKEIHACVTKNLPTKPAKVAFARCVSIKTFYDHHLRPERKKDYTHFGHYRDYIDSDQNPTSQLMNDLKLGILIPAIHSWLVPYYRIRTSDVDEIKSLLAFHELPPYVVMVFSVSSLKSAGVEVREQRGIDAIPNRHTEWFPNNVPGERINSDIPRSALTSIEWRS